MWLSRMVLGNKEEYGVVDGKEYGDAYQPGRGLMNDPDEMPFPRHVPDFVRDTPACTRPRQACRVVEFDKGRK
jgi:hypothetical protein